MNSETNSYLIKCSCGCGMLEAELFDYSDPECGFNFVLWARDKDAKQIISWKERFRWCWQILKTGSPWTDHIIVTNKDARGLANYILQTLPHEESNEEPRKK